MLPTVISFWTPNCDYSAHAERLAGECEALGLKHMIPCMEDRGDYLANCRHKPEVILECLRALHSPVLWVDVDSSIFRKPVELDGIGVDFAAVRKPKEMRRVWYACCLYFTPAAVPFVERWVEATNQDQWSDDSALDRTWREHGHTISAKELPQTYFHILDRGFPLGETVIGTRISSGEQKARFLNAQSMRS